jgi:hypothetical protein
LRALRLILKNGYSFRSSVFVCFVPFVVKTFRPSALQEIDERRKATPAKAQGIRMIADSVSFASLRLCVILVSHPTGGDRTSRDHPTRAVPAGRSPWLISTANCQLPTANCQLTTAN